MNVVRRGSAVLAVTGVVLLGPVGAVSASIEQLPPDDPSISEQPVDNPATPTAVLEDAAGGCQQDPVICQSGVAPTSVGGGAQLPRTGADDRLLATGAVGAALLLAGAGAGAVAAGRRHRTV